MVPNATGRPVVKLHHISKRFGSTQSLDDVSLEIGAAEIHALVGENGAGKSTLGKIIGGVYSPDAGTLTVAGVTSHGWTTRQALASGVATIQQELSLVPAMSVAENVFGDPEKANRWLRQPLGIIDGKTPLELARTDAGARVVEQLLAKLDWGAAA